jgi:hypothetical protein
MARKKTKPVEPPAPKAEPISKLVPDAAGPGQKQEQPSPFASADLPKTAAVALLAVLVLAMAYYFITSAATTFVPGPGVDPETFKDIFNQAGKVYIFMDVRGVSNAPTSRNILQCGVDFAGSSGMGGKDVSYFSVGNDGCVAEDGPHPPEYCFKQVKDGVVIYVKEGASSSYHSNAIVVGVGPEYPAGSCSIRRA